MKKKEKQGLLLLILVAVIIIGIVWAVTRGSGEGEKEVGTTGGTTSTEYVKEEEDGTKVNTSDKVNEARKIDGITIDDIRLEEKNGQTTLIADLTNTTEENVDRFLVDIVLYDKSGKEIGTIPGIVGQMEPGETIQMQVGITEDYVGAYDFKIVKK